MNINNHDLFIELIQVAIGKRDRLSVNPSLIQWQTLYRLSQEQAISGICLKAINTLYQRGQIIPRDLSFEWIMTGELIRQRNLLVNQRAAQITEDLEKRGIRSCILKGQGIASFYPDPLNRSSGDIDIWLDGTREDIQSFVKLQYPSVKECYWHIDYPVFNDVPVEVHFIPSYARSPKYDKRLQLYFSENRDSQFNNRIKLIGVEGFINVPTAEFSLIQQLSHVMRHFFIEGIGLRQIMDIYYLIQNEHSSIDYESIPDLLGYLGMSRFAGGVMWIMKSIFLMEDSLLICPSDKKRGQLLLDEILRGGNWGRHSKNIWKKIGGFAPFISRNLRFVMLFPYEAIITPISRRIDIIKA